MGPSGCRFRVKGTGTAAATGMAATTDMEATPMATVIKAMVMAAATGIVGIMVTAAMAMVETKDMEVATDMAVARVTAPGKAMEETMVATRAMVAATGATRAMVAATEEIRDMANSLTAATKDMVSSRMAATKDMEGNRAVTITRATAREGMQRTSTAGKPPDTPHDSSKNWLV